MKKTIKITLLIVNNYQASYSCLLMSDGLVLDIYDTVIESCNHSESFKYNICNNNILLSFDTITLPLDTVTALFVRYIYVGLNYIQCIVCLSPFGVSYNDVKRSMFCHIICNILNVLFLPYRCRKSYV